MKSLMILLAIIAIPLFNLHAQEIPQRPGNEDDETDGVLSAQCGGTERWSEKTLTDAAVNTINFTPHPATILQLVSINTPPPSTSMPRYGPVEDSTYVVTCNITIKKDESDNDYHLVLSDGSNTMIGEVPDPTCSVAATSQYATNFATCRNWVDTHIGTGTVSSINIAPVRIVGVAFIDPPHGQTGAAPNNLELHPILYMDFADSSTVGINKLQSDVSFEVYPNPATGLFNVFGSNLENNTVQIYNVFGQRIYQSLCKSAHEQIDLSAQPAGTYFVKVINDQQSSPVKKIIKQ